MPTDGIKPVKLVETLGARFTLCDREDTIETLRNGGGTECSNVNRLKLFISENPPEDGNLYPIPFLAGGGSGTGKSHYLWERVNNSLQGFIFWR